LSEGLERSKALIAAVPRDRPVSLLLRHAARPEQPDQLPDSSVPLTEEGVADARALGRALAGRLRSVHTSPVLRCRRTALLLAQPGEAPVATVVPVMAPTVLIDRQLGGPGVFVIDEPAAGQTWAREGHERVMTHLCQGTGEWPGLADPSRACQDLLRHLLDTGQRAAEPGLLVFVTHDSLLAPVLTRWFAPEPVAWPGYLDAIALWRDGEAIVATHGDHRRTRPRWW
jgi:broad specificity phosphatase PhoE